MSSTQTRRQLVSIAEAAVALDVHPQTLRKHLRGGDLPIRSVRIGRRIGIVREDIEALVGRMDQSAAHHDRAA